MTMQAQIDKLVAKVDGLSLRERALIFGAAAFLVVSLIDSLLLNPLLVKQKRLSDQVVQQQEKMKELQSQIAALLQAKQADANSPQRKRVRELRQQLDEGAAYLKARRDKLVPPEKMAELLEQMLNKNGRLQLVALNTLPVSLLIEPSGEMAASQTPKPAQVDRIGKTDLQARSADHRTRWLCRPDAISGDAGEIAHADVLGRCENERCAVSDSGVDPDALYLEFGQDMATGLKILLAALLCASQIAAAEPLPDPTRPAIDLSDAGKGGRRRWCPMRRCRADCSPSSFRRNIAQQSSMAKR